MAAGKTAIGALALAIGLALTSVTPASAEFFGCKEPHTTVSYSSRPLYQPQRTYSQSRYTHEFTAQRTQHAAYARPAAHRLSDRW